MKANLYEGDSVRHKAKADWGIGIVVESHRCGTIKVVFPGTREVSIAQGAKYLIKVDEAGNKVTTPKAQAS